MKKTKKSLFLSTITLLLCSCMFIGSTFAWFTDTVSNTGNKIQAGTLKVDLLMDKNEEHDATKYVSIKNETASVFSGDILWEPGQTQLAYLAVSNEGNLAFKYNLVLDIIDKQEHDTETEPAIAKAFSYAIVDSGKNVTNSIDSWDDAKAKATTTGNLLAAIRSQEGQESAISGRITAAPNGKLLAGEKDYFAVVIHMDEEAGNAYQKGLIEIDVHLVATQQSYEKDGFGSDQYDFKAEYPIVSSASIKIKEKVNEDLTINAVGSIKESKVSKEAANDVFDTMKDKSATSNELTLTLKVTENGNTTEGISEIVNLDIDMMATMISVKDGVEYKNQKEVKELVGYSTINYKLPAGKENVVAKHNGHVMVKLDSVDDTTKTDNGYGFYFYKKDNGLLTIKTKTFSPFTVSYDMENWLDYAAESFSTPVDTANKTITISSAEELALFAKDIAKYSNYTVNLVNDIDLDGKLWGPIASYVGTIDGKDHIINNLTIYDMKKDHVGFIGIFGGTIKNLTFNSAYVAGPRAAVVCQASGNSTPVVIENVNVYSSIVYGEQKNAGILGFAAGGPNFGCTDVTIRNCVVDGLEFLNDETKEFAWQSGAIIGYVFSQTNLTITGNKVSNVSISFDPATNYPTYQNYRSHEFIGTIDQGNSSYDSSQYTIAINDNSIKKGTGFFVSDGTTEFCGGHTEYNSPYIARITYNGKVLNPEE